MLNILLTILLSMFAPTIVDWIVDPLEVASSGMISGTGSEVLKYENGATKQVHTYSRGRHVRSQWFRPDGTLIEETDWTAGPGDAIYLREDGSVKSRTVFFDDVAWGPSLRYDEHGAIEHVDFFVNGQRIEPIRWPDQSRWPEHVPVVPPNPARERYLGTWLGDGWSMTIGPADDGSITIQGSTDERVREAITNVHWQGDTLCYELFHDYSRLFRTNDQWQRAWQGRACIALRLSADGQTLTLDSEIEAAAGDLCDISFSSESLQRDQ